MRVVSPRFVRWEPRRCDGDRDDAADLRLAMAIAPFPTHLPDNDGSLAPEFVRRLNYFARRSFQVVRVTRWSTRAPPMGAKSRSMSKEISMPLK